MKSEIDNDRILTRSGSPKEIIIAPLYALMAEGTVYRPNIVRSSYKYSWGDVQNYFYYTLDKDTPPMHSYCELVDEDYVFYYGASLTYRSWYLLELAAMGAIHNDYKNALLIVCQDDWRLETVDRRMLEGLCNFVISPLMKLFNIGHEHVLHLDTILTRNALEIAMSQDKIEKRFNVEETKYFDSNWLQVILKKYPK